MRSFILVFVSFFLLGCSPKNNQSDHSDTTTKSLFELPDWARSANIYEVNIRQYTPEGTINAFRSHLPRLKNMGVDILWFMPIYPISTTKKKGTLGSYYSVNDFTQINPEFGTMADVDAMIKEIHDLDMNIILDWVPNHTGWDHVWLKNHKSWYTQDKDGNVIDPHNENGESHGWTDVADLNYDSEDMRNEMLSQLMMWVKDKDIDGYRMDIAFGVPDDFWHDVRDSLYAIKPIFMLAESENAEHRNDSIFHATYGWNLFHVMNDIARGKSSVKDFIGKHKENSEKFQRGSTLLFTSNHDENAWNGTTMERLGDSAEGWAVVMALLDGIPLIYGGMENPLEKRLEFFEKDTIDFSKLKYEKFYKDLFAIKDSNPALHNSPYGAKALFMNVNEVIIFTRSTDENQVTVVFNPTKNDVELTNPDFPEHLIFGSPEIADKNVVTPNSYAVFSNKK